MLQLDLDLRHRGIEHAQGLLEQLLAGLVALEDDNPQLVGHSGEESEIDRARPLFLVRSRGGPR